MTQTETTTVIVIAAIAVLVGWRVWRAMREQRMKVAWMWITPTLVAALAAWMLIIDGLTQPADIGLAVVALALGAATGLYQGTHTTVRTDRSAGLIYVKTKPIGAAIVVAVIAARILLRMSAVLPTIQRGAVAGTIALPPKGDAISLISAMLFTFALGVILGLRVYLFRKYRASDVPAAG
jgi:Protein of unknown function (DUF1453)